MFPANKTKIVCTIGPASASPAVMEKMLLAGMNVARLNFSHGSFDEHARVIADLRAVAQRTGKRVAIMADLSGPKIRIGELAEPVELAPGASFELTCQQLQFSYGVSAVHAPGAIDDLRTFARDWVRREGLSGEQVVFMGGPSEHHPDANHRMEIVDLRSQPLAQASVGSGFPRG